MQLKIFILWYNTCMRKCVHASNEVFLDNVDLKNISYILFKWFNVKIISIKILFLGCQIMVSFCETFRHFGLSMVASGELLAWSAGHWPGNGILMMLKCQLCNCSSVINLFFINYLLSLVCFMWYQTTDTVLCVITDLFVYMICFTYHTVFAIVTYSVRTYILS